MGFYHTSDQRTVMFRASGHIKPDIHSPRAVPHPTRVPTPPRNNVRSDQAQHVRTTTPPETSPSRPETHLHRRLNHRHHTKKKPRRQEAAEARQNAETATIGCAITAAGEDREAAHSAWRCSYPQDRYPAPSRTTPEGSGPGPAGTGPPHPARSTSAPED